jgi:hypothetical protein
MSRWTARASVAGEPDEVLDLLTQPEAIRSWAPIPSTVSALDGDRLEAGSIARVRGGLAGRSVPFDVDVIEAGDGRLSLVASGPITLDVAYDVRAVARVGRSAPQQFRRPREPARGRRSIASTLGASLAPAELAAVGPAAGARGQRRLVADPTAPAADVRALHGREDSSSQRT